MPNDKSDRCIAYHGLHIVTLTDEDRSKGSKVVIRFTSSRNHQAYAGPHGFEPV